MTTVREIPSQVLYEACVKGLKTMGGVIFNSSMPKSGASKVNVCSQVLAALETAGFRNGLLTYSAILYPNEGDTRTLLMWLNQNVKINQVDQDKPPASAKDVLQTAISLELKRSMAQSWAPVVFSATHDTRPVATVSVRSAYIEPPIGPQHAKEIEYISRFMPFAVDQPRQPELVCMSLLEAHAVSLAVQREKFLARNDRNNPPAKKRARVNALVAGKLRQAVLEEGDEYLLMKQASSDRNRRGLASRFIRQRNQIDKVDAGAVAVSGAGGKTSEEEAREAREAELAALEAELKRLEYEIQAMRLMLTDLIAGKRQLDADAAAVAARTAELEKDKAEIEMVRRLMQDPEGNKAKLEQITQLNAQKLVEAAQKWEPKRVQLIEGYRAERDKFENRKSAAQDLLQDIEAMRAKARGIAQDIQEKDQRYRNLLEQWKSLEKGKLRSMHTDKILEGLENVKKQNADIDKVLLETRALKKEIAGSTDTLSRSFALVDEMIYKDAPNDASAKTAYKLLVAMNEKFNDLIDGVSTTVATRNEALELERKIDALKIRTDSLNLERVEADLKTLKQENVNLSVQANMTGNAE